MVGLCAEHAVSQICRTGLSMIDDGADAHVSHLLPDCGFGKIESVLCHQCHDLHLPTRVNNGKELLMSALDLKRVRPKSTIHGDEIAAIHHGCVADLSCQVCGGTWILSSSTSVKEY